MGEALSGLTREERRARRQAKREKRKRYRVRRAEERRRDRALATEAIWRLGGRGPIWPLNSSVVMNANGFRVIADPNVPRDAVYLFSGDDALRVKL